MNINPHNVRRQFFREMDWAFEKCKTDMIESLTMLQLPTRCVRTTVLTHDAESNMLQIESGLLFFSFKSKQLFLPLLF